MTSNGVSVYVITNNAGSHKPVTHDLSPTKLAFFSDMPVGGANNQRIAAKSVILNKTTADGKAAARITSWIAQNDIENPKPMSPNVLNLETFDDCVNVLATSNAMHIKREKARR